MPCVFGDLEQCIPRDTFCRTDTFMEKLVKVDNAPIFETQHCFTHNKLCKLDQDSDLEVSGLPCWDYSLAGKRLGEEGPTISAFLTHAKRHCHSETRLIIVENVKDVLHKNVTLGLKNV